MSNHPRFFTLGKKYRQKSLVAPPLTSFWFPPQKKGIGKNKKNSPNDGNCSRCWMGRKGGGRVKIASASSLGRTDGRTDRMGNYTEYESSGDFLFVFFYQKGNRCYTSSRCTESTLLSCFKRLKNSVFVLWQKGR